VFATTNWTPDIQVVGLATRTDGEFQRSCSTRLTDEFVVVFHLCSGIVPFAQGGALDGLTRPLAQQLSEVFRQPFIVENRSGGAGSIGTELGAKALPDGYTLNMGTPSNFAVYKKLGYDPINDFAPAGTPREIVMRLHAEVVRAVRLPENQKRIRATGSEPIGSTPEETTP
jgi:tripartite-type tricarboxylate transporter receptor subunit TctC